MIPTLELWLFVGAILIQAALIAHAWQLRKVGLARAFLILMGLALLWTGAFFFETILPGLNQKLGAARIQFLAIPLLPAAWLHLALTFSGKHISRRVWLLVLLPPTLTALVAWFAPVPNPFWGPFELDTLSAPFPILRYHYNWWFYAVHAASSYLIVLAAYWRLGRALRSQHDRYIGQGRALFLAALLPTLSDILYVLGFSPIPYFNPTPLVFCLSGLLISWALVRYRLLDLVPMARDLVFMHMSDGIVVLDNRYRIIDYNPAAFELSQVFARTLGISREEVRSGFLVEAAALCESGEENKDICLGRGAQRIYVDLRCSAISDQQGTRQGSVISFRDITERVLLYQEVENLSARDSLTNAFSRRRFLELAEKALSQACEQPDREIAVVVLDVDHFKQINDTHGHAAGDQVLAEMTAILLENCRAADIIGRLGGDEFAMVLPGAAQREARAIVERLQVLMRSRPVCCNGHLIPYSVSFGIAAVLAGRTDQPNLDSLINQADLAMLRAKVRRRRLPEPSGV